jgi:hypothetical protein
MVVNLTNEMKRTSQKNLTSTRSANARYSDSADVVGFGALATLAEFKLDFLACNKGATPGAFNV